MDNHDTQRGEAELTYKNGALYTLANAARQSGQAAEAGIDWEELPSQDGDRRQALLKSPKTTMIFNETALLLTVRVLKQS